MCWLGLSIASRQYELIQAKTFACDAAATAISVNNYSLAIEWLEQGRSVLWGQILHLRTPLVDDLRTSHPELAVKLKLIAESLEHGSSQAFLGGSDASMSLEKAVQHHHQLANEWEKALEEVRNLPNFEHFLLPKKYAELQDAGCNGPVVILNASKYRCDALIITPSLELHHIHLDKLTYEHADSLRKCLYVEVLQKQNLRDERAGGPTGRNKDHDATFRYILSQLWELVVEPILGCFESLQVSDQIKHYAHYQLIN
jgi:hypothetical protein